MSRRQRFSHRLLRVQQSIASDFDSDDVAVVLSLNGTTRLSSSGSTVSLGHGDAAVLTRASDVSFEVYTAKSGRMLSGITARAQ